MDVLEEAFSAATQLNRMDLGVSCNGPIPVGGMARGYRAEIALDIGADLNQPAPERRSTSRKSWSLAPQGREPRCAQQAWDPSGLSSLAGLIDRLVHHAEVIVTKEAQTVSA